VPPRLVTVIRDDISVLVWDMEEKHPRRKDIMDGVSENAMKLHLCNKYE
jgi:hypothetical protein